MLLKGCNEVWGHCLVLAGKTVSGYQKMGFLLGFHILIGPNADAKDKNQAIQDHQVPPAGWKSEWSAEVEFKEQPNDLLNFVQIKWSSDIPRLKMVNMNTTGTTPSCRKRRKANKTPAEDVSMVSSCPSSSETPAGPKSVNISNDNSNRSNTFQQLWTELAMIESPPKYWNLFTAVSEMEKMDQSWRHYPLAVKSVRYNISPQEADDVRNIMHNLNLKRGPVMLGVEVNRDRIALENAFAYNLTLFRFKQQLDCLQEGIVKDAYLRFHSYFENLIPRKADFSGVFKEEVKVNMDPHQYNAIRGASAWTSPSLTNTMQPNQGAPRASTLRQGPPPNAGLQFLNLPPSFANPTHVIPQTPIFSEFQQHFAFEESVYCRHGAGDLFRAKLRCFIEDLHRNRPATIAMHNEPASYQQAPQATQFSTVAQRRPMAMDPLRQQQAPRSHL